MKQYIDLHTHSTASDGSLSPTELVRRAHAARLAAVALTDHDTIDGLDEALRAGQALGFEVVPGVEVSAVPLLEGHLHLLGLFIATQGEARRQLEAWLTTVRSGRNRRNPQIITRLQALGIDITLAEVEARAIGGLVGRPHIGQVLVEKRVVRNNQEAFERYLAKGAAAYVDRERVTPAEAIEAIHRAGGLAILAHPHYCGARDNGELQRYVQQLKDLGLDGLEVRYPTFTVDQEALFSSLARELGLLESGGSDFHGQQKPGLELGVGYGGMRVLVDYLDRMKAVLARREGPVKP